MEREEKVLRFREIETAIEKTKILLEEKEQIKLECESLEKELLDAINEKLDEAKRMQEKMDKELEMEQVSEFFQNIDVNKDEKITKLEMVTSELFDQNQDGQVSDDEMQFFLAGHEEFSLDSFQQNAWPHIKPRINKEKNSETTVPQNDEDFDYSIEDSETDEEFFEDENEDKPTRQNQFEYDNETQTAVNKAENARTEFENVNRKLRDLQKEADALRNFLDRNYGEDDEYLTLANNCYEFTDTEYTYKACLFDECSQKKKHGGSETRLGTFQRWEQSENNGHVMYFTGGQQCWNGPSRSTTLKINCGLEIKLISTSEPSKCEYEMVMESPTACHWPIKADTNHDEL